MLRSGYIIAAMLLAASFGSFALSQSRPAPFVPVGVTYRSAAAPAQVIGDLRGIREAGFNVVRALVSWREVESAPREYTLSALERLLRTAADVELKVVIQIDIGRPPDWLLEQYPDGRFVPEPSESSAPGRSRPCLDHEQLRTDAMAFVFTVVEQAARFPALYAVDVGSDLPRAFCSCPHTRRAFEQWRSARPGSTSRVHGDTADKDAFVVEHSAEQARGLANASRTRRGRLMTTHVAIPSVLRGVVGGTWQDDWLMRPVADYYGTSLQPSAAVTSTQWLNGLDGIRSAAQDRGWWWMQDPRVSNDGLPEGSVREVMWTAVARGARGLVLGEGNLEESGGVARAIARNPALFAPLRPRPSSIAIVYDRRGSTAGASRTADVHRALIERNIPVDFIRAGEVAARGARYRMVLSDLSPPVQELLERTTRAGVGPEVRVENGTQIETRFLESPDVLMLIAINHSDRAQRVTLRFTPDTQEAIWQNMETGANVNFVAGPDGPIHTSSFAPRGTLVLMIRKDLR
jgi:Beta-galactosidase